MLWLTNALAQSVDTLTIFDKVSPNSVQPHLYAITNISDDVEVDSITKIPLNRFIAIDSVLSKLKRNRSHWFVLNIKNNSKYSNIYYLEAGITQIIDFYDPNESGLYVKKSYGYSVPDAQKEYSEVVAEIVGFRLEARQTKTLYFRVKSELNLKPSPLFKIHTQSDFKNHLSYFNMIQGIFHGLLWMMIAYMLFLFLNIRDRAYLYYILYALTASVAILILIGYPRNYFFRSIEFNVLYSEIIFQIGAIFYMLLFRKALDIKRLSRFWSNLYAMFIGIAGMGVLITAICLYFDFYTYNLISQIFILFQLTSYVIIIIGLFRFKNKENVYYFIGNILLTIGAFIITVGLLFLHEPFLKYFPVFQVGISFEILFFALGLSKRFQSVEEQKRFAQQELIKELKEKEALQKQINEDLEDLVTERTIQISKSKQEIEQQKAALALKHLLLEESNKKLTENLEYAGFIQNALLDDFEKIKPLFDDSFLLFKPHSYVSGDFYMFAELPGEQTLIIVADCTGHGVPGAILTIIAQDFLQDIIFRKEIYQPADILTALEDKIRSRLLNIATNKTLHEGLEASVLLIERRSKLFHYSGAKLPLYYRLNKNIIRVKGSLYGIGGEFVELNQKKHFVQKTFTYNVGDSVYLSTDGYWDQLSQNNRKFKSSRYLDLLDQIADLSFDEQKLYMLSEHTRWKGKKDQTDDMLIVGVKL